MKYFTASAVVIGILFCLGFAGFYAQAKDTTPQYATWYGTGPDKWASIWLISRHIAPNSSIELFPEGYSEEGYVFFDTPISEYNRDAQMTSYRKLLSSFKVDDPGTQFIDTVLHDIDITLWQAPEERLSPIVEAGFRELQNRYGREGVSAECYLAFFDQVQAVAALDPTQKKSLAVQSLLPNEGCNSEANHNIGSAFVVPELPITDVIERMLAGQKVVFVDVRESQEYVEGHIPGAVNLKIRETDQYSVNNAMFSEADVIIPYCVKDFRGYEMAKKLKQLGKYNVALMQPYGLKGWIHSDLPLSDAELSTTEAKELLSAHCNAQAGSCGF